MGDPHMARAQLTRQQSYWKEKVLAAASFLKRQLDKKDGAAQDTSCLHMHRAAPACCFRELGLGGVSRRMGACDVSVL